MAAFPCTPILDTGQGVAESPMPEARPWLSGVFSGGYPNCSRDGSGNFFTTDTAGAGSRWPTIFAADMQVYAQIAVGLAANDQLAIWYGHTVLNRGYSWRYYRPSGTNILGADQWLGGVPTAMINPITQTLQVGDWIGAQRIGSTHTFFISKGSLPGGWQQIAEVVNVATTGAGRIGMEIYNNASAAPTGKLTNFGGGAIFLGDMGQVGEIGRGAVR